VFDSYDWGLPGRAPARAASCIWPARAADPSRTPDRTAQSARRRPARRSACEAD
jgi:hypothetical protein